MKTSIAGFLLPEGMALSANQGQATQGEVAEELLLNIIGWWGPAGHHDSGSSEVLLLGPLVNGGNGEDWCPKRPWPQQDA